MLLLLILPVLVSGYIVFQKHHYHFYRLHRFNGQLLYIGCASFGLICTTIGFIIVLLLNSFAPAEVSLFGYKQDIDIATTFAKLVYPISKNDAEKTTLLFLGGVASPVVAWLWCSLSNLKLKMKVIDLPKLVKLQYKNLANKIRGVNQKSVTQALNSRKKVSLDEKAKILLMSSILKDSPLDKLFLESYLYEEFLMLTLDDKKVYVGRVTSLGEPNEAEGLDQEICITPFLSGYRDKDTHTVKFTTKYRDLSDEIEIVLRQDKVIAATKFVEKVYEQFKLKKRMIHVNEEF